MDLDKHVVLIALGALFAIGMATDALGRRLRLPRVTLLILFGALAGPVGFDVVPEAVTRWYEFLATMALTMVAFLLGGELTLKAMRSHGRTIIVISVAVVTATVAFVTAGLALVGVALPLALLIAGIATATDPAATRDVIRQSRAEGPFSETLQGVVAIDDAWGLIAFSLILIVVNALVGNGVATVLEHAAWEFGGAVGVGVAVGVPAAYLSGRVREGEPSQAEALAVVFLIAGLSEWLGVSFLMAGVVAGLIVVNCAKHHTRPFSAIEGMEYPFMLLFFFLAGASLQIDHGRAFATVIGAYAAFRILSRAIGGWVGCRLSDAPAAWRPLAGLALLPQAGVAVGMALVAANHFPQYREVILPVAIGTTVLFEIFGPFATMIALRRAGEARDA